MLTTRITPELRAGLEREARRSGRSLSQEIESRLTNSLNAQKEKFGNPRNKALALLVSKLARGVEEITGRSWRHDRFTHDALRSAVNVLLGELAPMGEAQVSDRVMDLISHLSKTAPQHANQFRQPDGVGASCAFGLLGELRNAEFPPLGHAANVFYANEFFELPHARKALEIDGGSPQ
jgi:hypothetical protein